MTFRLSDLKVSEAATITSVLEGPLTLRLMEMGFLVGEKVTVKHVAPYAGDPIVVEVRGGLVAIRRQEALFVSIDKEKV